MEVKSEPAVSAEAEEVGQAAEVQRGALVGVC